MSLVNNLDNIFKKGVIGNVRKAQEDSHDMALKTPNGDLFVVCDGMGGHVGGAKASSLAVESIISYMKGQYYPNPIDALNGSLQFANMQILGFADAHPEYKGMGTTACIVLMRDNDVWIAHAGDSRIYLYLGKERQLHRITRDHSLVQTLVDSGQITDDEAEHHPNKNRILKALGIKPELKPTFNHLNQPIHPKNGDIFLICSDGLSGEICDKTIEKVLSENTNIQEKGEILIALAMQGENGVPGGKDNCTVELIQIDNSPWEKRQFKSFNPAGRPQLESKPVIPKTHSDVPKCNITPSCTNKKKDGSIKRKANKKIFVTLSVVLALTLITIFAWKPISIKYYNWKLNNINTEIIELSSKRKEIEKNISDLQKKINEINENIKKKGEGAKKLRESAENLRESAENLREKSTQTLKNKQNEHTTINSEINNLHEEQKNIKSKLEKLVVPNK